MKNNSPSPLFAANYLYKNAFERYLNDFQTFMFWRRGSFLPPHKKEQYIQKFMEEEQRKYFEKGIFSLPSVQFAITTRCTLRCRDCSVMIPCFGRNGQPHIDLDFAHFKRDFDALVGAVDYIGTVLLLGGEPLLHRELPEMVAYAAKNDKVGLVDIVTNCTILPSRELLESVAEFRHKVFFGLSNYSGNPDLAPVLKRTGLIELLKKNDIKHSLDTGEGKWFKFTLEKCNYSPEQMKAIFANCHWHHCLYVLDGILVVCPRSLIGHTLGAFSLKPDDMIVLRDSDQKAIRSMLIEFYEKGCLEACQYCCRHGELVEPAVQLTK